MPPDDPREPSGGARRTWRPADRGDDAEPTALGGLRSRLNEALRTQPVRGRRVRRTVRHIEPWSVLKIALLFHAAIFLILCVASAILWSAARASGQLDNVESFVTSVGGFGNCEPVAGVTTTTTTTTTLPEGEVDQLDPSRGSTTVPDDESLLPEDRSVVVDDDEDCPEGEHLVGEFHFEDGRIFTAFAFGGVVLVLAGTGATVVLVLLFNLMSDLTGGVQMTVIEEEARPRRRPEAGSPPRSRAD